MRAHRMGKIASGISVVFLLGMSAWGLAQGAPDIAGTWQGTLPLDKGLRTVLKVSKAESGWKAELYAVDQDEHGRAASSIGVHGDVLSFAIASADMSYEGKISADGTSILGVLHQGSQTFPLSFARANSETAWKIDSVKKMAKDAEPAFEVATIKPTDPNNGRTGFHSGNGRRISCDNETVNAILSFVYGVQKKQILGGPAWFESDKFDIDGVPDAPGVPDYKQMQGMYAKLLAERFGLKFHRETRKMSVFAITAAKVAPKLTRSVDQGGMSDTTFTEFNSRYVVLRVTSTTMEEFAQTMQSVVLDKPVVDQTRLAGKHDFLLKWTPDESQFVSWGARFSPGADGVNAAPSLQTALQDLGLKVETVTAPAEVLVIDHVERPSAN
jgi:uncharacterized protein (TIGR03435 family)